MKRLFPEVYEIVRNAPFTYARVFSEPRLSGTKRRIKFWLLMPREESSPEGLPYRVSREQMFEMGDQVVRELRELPYVTHVEYQGPAEAISVWVE